MADNLERSGCLGLVLRLFGFNLPVEAKKTGLPYRTEASLLTPAERSFFGVLQKAVGDRALIFAKVRVGDLLYVPRGKGMRAHQNRINSKHVDFVLCTVDTVRPLAAVELDDASHDRPDRADRDDFLNEAFHAATLPLYRFAARRQYDLREVAEAIRPVFDQVQASIAPSSFGGGSAPLCPTCQSSMIRRTASSGPRKGTSFYGCSNYPKCRAIVEIDSIH